MKNRRLVHYHESARIYRKYYRPSFNIIRLFRSVLSIVLTGSSPSAGMYHKEK